MNTHDDDQTASLLARALREEAAMSQPQPDALQQIQARIASPASPASPASAASAGSTTSGAPLADSSDRGRGLGAWTSRTNGDRSRWSWLGGAFGAGLATAAVITAVVLVGNQGSDNSAPPAGQPSTLEPTQAEPTQAEPTQAEPTETVPTVPEQSGEEATTAAAPSPEPAPEATTAPPNPEPGPGLAPHQAFYDPNAPADRQVTMYYAGPGGRLYTEPHTLPAAPDDPALAAAQEWWTSLPIDPDLTPVMMGRTDLHVVEVSQSGKTTTIALKGPEGSTSEDQSFLAGDHLVGSPAQQHSLVVSHYQALLRTAGVTGEARFTYNGEAVGESNGVRLDPLRAMPDDEIRPWIEIVNIVEGQTVSNPVTVTVSANVVEGNVNWELLDEAGKKIDESFVTTAMGMWRKADIELGTLSPGIYEIRCIEYSMEDGSVRLVEDKTFTVE